MKINLKLCLWLDFRFGLFQCLGYLFESSLMSFASSIIAARLYKNAIKLWLIIENSGVTKWTIDDNSVLNLRNVCNWFDYHLWKNINLDLSEIFMYMIHGFMTTTMFMI